MNEFSRYVNRENEKRNWSYSDLARAAGVGKSSISWALSTGRPGTKVSQGIAKAYKTSVEEVYREAGLLPQVDEDSAWKKAALHLLELLPSEDRDTAITLLEGLVQHRERQRTKHERNKKGSPIAEIPKRL